MTILDGALFRALALLGVSLLATEAAAQGASPTVAAAESVPLEMKGYALGDMVLGSADAPVTIYEYSSFTCGHCANFHTRTLPSIKEKYVDTGKVRIVFREVYFEQLGLWASMMARCAGPDAFFDKIEVIYAKQGEWARAGAGQGTPEGRDLAVARELARIGRLEGLSAERVQACLTDEAYMLRLLGDFQKHDQQDNIRATPTFIINGTRVEGDQSVEAFSALIDKHL